MADPEVMLDKMTRREFREAIEAGRFETAIIPTGAVEQHLEHLAMEHDIRSATEIALLAARRLYPRAVVAAPLRVGISEHHMQHKGTLSAKPGSWLAVLFDAVESMFRHGCRNVLVLNGHSGNEAPVEGAISQWRSYFESGYSDANLKFHCYWELSRAEAEEICPTGVPGHAQEYETSIALHLFPENVRRDAMQNQEDKLSLEATAGKGQALVEAAVHRTVECVEAMIERLRS
jgi:creatinine amidohydrolase